MAKKNSETEDKNASSSALNGKNYPLASTGLIFGCCLVISFLSFDPENIHASGTLDIIDSSSPNTIPLLGELGNYLAYYNFAFLGISSWVIPLLFFTISYLFFKGGDRTTKIKKSGSLILILASSALLADIQFPHFENNQKLIAGGGGYLGKVLYSGLPLDSSSEAVYGIFGRYLGPLGSIIAGIVVFLLGITSYFSQSKNWFQDIAGTIRDYMHPKQKVESENEVQQKNNEPLKSSNKSDSKFSLKKLFSSLFRGTSDEDDLLFSDVSKNQKSDQGFAKSESHLSIKKKRDIKQKEDFSQLDDIENTKIDTSKEENPEPAYEEVIEETVLEEVVSESTSQGMDGFKVVRQAKTEKAADLFPEMKGDYHFPTLDLLMDPPEEEGNEDEDHMIKARNLKDTLSEFKVDIELGEVHTGPVITRYDVHPAPGVRVEKISNLDKNLAMALRADSVRILAPVPGKGCVGIEVPNQNPSAVCLKEILQSKAWADAGAEIPIVLGKEASGRALVADLTKMPHLLVAGSTGSGKTVCINAIIASLCYYSSPEDVRFIMVDPKIVEMKVYNDLPHMLIPVVTEPKKVPGALKWLLVEMERRYQIFSKVGVRNIAGFNAKILKDKEEKEKAQLLDAEMTAEERAALSSIEVPRDDDALEVPENKLPYIVCIIDELADLMMVAQADVETGIARLAQLARAAGIHLIIATQRPSVNVITGVIKANLPSRISFRVASYRDSQTILDGKGAEALIGKGDMLFIPPGSSTFVRAQGAFVSDDEINGIVDYLKINGPPQIVEEVREQIESAGEDDILGKEGEDSDEDPMVRKAIEVIRTTKRASTSNLQRKLSIGYNRAARIMDDLEDRGLVGPDLPGQGREILMDL